MEEQDPEMKIINIFGSEHYLSIDERKEAVKTAKKLSKILSKSDNDNH